MKRDAIYGRRSSKNQEDNTSVATQLEVCGAKAGPNPLTYIDSSETGTKMSRPEFNRMLCDAEAGKFDRLIVYKFDRFGRSAYAHGIVADLESLGVTVLSATEGKDPLVRGVHLLFAEDSSRKLSERCRLGRRRRFQEGKHLGGVTPFGYEVVDGRLKILADEAAAVRDVYRWLATGSSQTEAARRLQAQGWRPRRASEWTANSISQMLASPIYRGIRRLRDEQAYTPGLRIIADADHREAADACHARRRGGCGGGGNRPASKARALSGLLHCGACGHGFYRRQITLKSGDREPPRWHCGRRYLRDKCRAGDILLESDILDPILATVRGLLADPTLVADLADAAERAVGRDAGSAGRLRAEIATATAESARLVAVLASGKVPLSASGPITDQIAAAEDRRTAAEASLQAADSRGGGDPAEVASAVVAQARADFRAVVAEPDLNVFLRRVVGPMDVMDGGAVVQREILTAPGLRGPTLQPSALLQTAFWACYGRFGGAA